MNTKLLLLALLCLITNELCFGLDKKHDQFPKIQTVVSCPTPDSIIKFMETDHGGRHKLYYDTANWRPMIDKVWGEGVSTAEKLRIFNHYWDTLNTAYPCFYNLKPIDWDSVIQSFRQEIANGVSRGRFAAIMSQLNLMINDGHSGFHDAEIKYSTLYQGLPLISPNGRFHFAGCLTPLPDSTVLVYQAPAGNCFQLEPGDIILGYNNRNLSELTQEVLDKQLPIESPIGSTYYATWHYLISSVASSWNLYDTIDIKKVNGNIVHFPTSLMVGKYYSCDCYEILPPEGIKFPGINRVLQVRKQMASGVVSGTNTGYVTLFDCLENTGDSLLNRVKYLVEKQNIGSLIIDIRTNFGGTIQTFYKTFAYLNDGDLIRWTSYAERYHENDRYSMTNYDWYSQYYDIFKTEGAYFNKPIALITGPGAISAGDLMNITFRNHPNLKTFGKPTAAAYGCYIPVDLQSEDYYYASLQGGNFYLMSNPGQYLSHLDIPVDFPVWLTPEGVAKGKDDVMEAAIKWINTVTDVPEIAKNDNELTIFPNPAEDDVILNLPDKILQDNGPLTLNCYNLYGSKIISKNYSNVESRISLNVNSLPAGIYVIEIETTDNVKLRTKLIKMQN
jgi:hypothetical protein